MIFQLHCYSHVSTKKSSENKDYCKRCREKNCATYQKNDAERKIAQRGKVKWVNPELYELKKRGAWKKTTF